MPPALRRAQILERIQRDGGVSVSELARDHAVSPITVHRDLEQLAREGLVERVHGGAKARRGIGAPAIATAWEQRVHQAGPAKAAVAEHAARTVASGSTIFLDASSTALALARRLMEHPPNELTLVTNSPAIAHEALAEPMHVVVCPGELDQHMRMLAARAEAARTVGLIDASKFGRASLVTIADAQELDLIVTDDELPEPVAEEYRAAG